MKSIEMEVEIERSRKAEYLLVVTVGQRDRVSHGTKKASGGVSSIFPNIRQTEAASAVSILCYIHILYEERESIFIQKEMIGREIQKRGEKERKSKEKRKVENLSLSLSLSLSLFLSLSLSTVTHTLISPTFTQQLPSSAACWSPSTPARGTLTRPPILTRSITSPLYEQEKYYKFVS